MFAVEIPASPYPPRWSRGDTVSMLAFLNSHLHLFTSDRRETGLRAAADFLTSESGQTYTARQVKDKIRRLWSNYGPDGSQSTDDIFNYGVCYRTLPSLEALEAGYFHDISVKSALLKPINSTGSTAEPFDGNGKARMLRSEVVGPNWRIACVCPFDFEDGGETVLCDSCGTWQHTFCYYEDESDVPKVHFCRNCEQLSDDTLTEDEAESILSRREMRLETSKTPGDQNSKIALDNNRDTLDPNTDDLKKDRKISELERTVELKQRHIRKLKIALEQTKFLGKFTTFGSMVDRYDFIPGPDDSEIRGSVYQVQHLIGRFAVSFPRGKISMPSCSQADSFGLLLGLLGSTDSALVTREDIKATVSSIRASYLLKAIIATAVRDWVFYSDFLTLFATDSAAYRMQNFCIYTRDGSEAVRNLHQATWSHLISSDSEAFKASVKTKAKSLTQRLLNALVPIFSRRPDEVEIGFKEQDIYSRLLEDIFRTCLELKAGMPLRLQYFELYAPQRGSTFDPALMETEQSRSTSGTVERGKVIICLIPAVIAYRTRREHAEEDDMAALAGLIECIDRQAGEREDGNIISKAVVLLQE